MTLEELESIHGIGEVKAVKLKILTEHSMLMICAKDKEGMSYLIS